MSAMNIYISTDDEIFSSLKTMEFTLPDDVILNGGLMGLKHFGIDPVNIRRKCRLNYNGNWRYLNENCNNN